MGCLMCGPGDCRGGLWCPAYKAQMQAQMQAQNVYLPNQSVMMRGGGGGGSGAITAVMLPITGGGGAFGYNAVHIAAPAPPNPIPFEGMKVEDLIGWRIWRVKNGHLWSFSADYAWMPGDVSEGVPGDHDSAGVWAFKEKRRAFQKAIESGQSFVWGSVRLWGQVVEHKDGYRASKARILSIDGATRDVPPEMVTDLCRIYRVPEIEVAPRLARQDVVVAPSGLVGFGELPPLPVEPKGVSPWPVLAVLFPLFVGICLLPVFFR